MLKLDSYVTVHDGSVHTRFNKFDPVPSGYDMNDFAIAWNICEIFVMFIFYL